MTYKITEKARRARTLKTRMTLAQARAYLSYLQWYGPLGKEYVLKREGSR